MSDLIGNVRTFKERFEQEKILTLKGYSFNQKQLIQFIEKYWDSQFLDGDSDVDGYRYFYNIVKFPTRLASKMIDLDTKDIRFIPEDGQPHVPVYFFNKELKAWMKDQNFGKVLNQIVQGTPKNGNFVLKVVGDELKQVRLINLVNDPRVETLDQSAVVIEEHYMTPNEVDSMPWNNKELISAWFDKNPNESFIKVDEIYAYEKGKRVRRIVAGLDDFEKDSQGKIIKDGLIYLTESEPRKKLPYFEFFWEEFNGRWLRVGVPEDLLEEQFRTNETINQQAQGLYWTSKKIYQTRDMTANKNLMTGVENGALLRVNSEITPVANEERNLAAFNTELQSWDKNRREKTFTLESISGESLPSATPFRLGFILQNAAGGYFDFKRENIGLGIKRLIYEYIAPTFGKSKRTKHIFNLIGEDSEYNTLEELMVEFILQEKIQKMSKSGGDLPSPEVIDEERTKALEKIKKRPIRRISIPEGFYDDIKYKVDIVITDESVAMESKIQTLTTVLQTISTNPAILQQESTKKLLFKIMDYAGVSPEEISFESQPQDINPETLAKLGTQSPPPGQLRPELQLSSNRRTL